MTNTIERMVDGVTVRKSFETDEFPVPAVTFEIESSREDPVEVTIADQIPDEIAMEQIGFHPDYHNDQWTAFPEGRVEFTHEFESRESITTIYGVRLDEDDSQEAFLQDPEITVDRLEAEATPEGVIDDPGPGAEPIDASDEGEDTSVADPDRTNVVREVIEGERDTVPGLGDEGEADVAEVDGGDHGDDEVAADAGTESQSSTDEPSAPEDERPGEIEEPEPTSEVEADSDEEITRGGATASVADESMVSALAQEIRSGDVDDDDLETIEDALRSDKSTETRIGHLQSRVSDLEAYSSAIEEFIDEHGSAQQLLQRVEEDLDSLSSRMDTLEATAEEAEVARQELHQNVDQVVDRIDSLEADIAAVSDDVDTLDNELDAVRTDINELDEDVEMVREDVQDRLDETVSDLEDNLEDVRDDVRDLREWRNQLTDVFGAGGGDDE